MSNKERKSYSPSVAEKKMIQDMLEFLAKHVGRRHFKMEGDVTAEFKYTRGKGMEYERLYADKDLATLIKNEKAEYTVRVKFQGGVAVSYEYKDKTFQLSANHQKKIDLSTVERGEWWTFITVDSESLTDLENDNEHENTLRKFHPDKRYKTEDDYDDNVYNRNNYTDEDDGPKDLFEVYADIHHYELLTEKPFNWS